MKIEEKITSLKNQIDGFNCEIVAVSKTKPVSDIQSAYDYGLRIFGENKVQELVEKHPKLPPDIKWHMIGHLQRNKVKHIASFIDVIESVDSTRLLKEISKQALRNDRVIKCLLQVHIATESHKFGFTEAEISNLLSTKISTDFPSVKIIGFMGMATFTSEENIIRNEFKSLFKIYQAFKEEDLDKAIDLHVLSMGMTDDFKIALEEGSSMIRIGSAIFGARGL